MQRVYLQELKIDFYKLDRGRNVTYNRWQGVILGIDSALGCHYI